MSGDEAARRHGGSDIGDGRALDIDDRAGLAMPGAYAGPDGIVSARLTMEHRCLMGDLLEPFQARLHEQR
jgi:hypothetical protein